MTVPLRLTRVGPDALAGILFAAPAAAQQVPPLEFAFSDTVELPFTGADAADRG